MSITLLLWALCSFSIPQHLDWEVKVDMQESTTQSLKLFYHMQKDMQQDKTGFYTDKLKEQL